MSSTLRPGAISHKVISLDYLSHLNTAISVMHMSTTCRPVKGNEHFSKNFVDPLAVCSIVTITFLHPETKSIAPPIPFTILPGIIQFARSPSAETYKPPSIERSILPPLIMAKLWDELKNEAPVTVVTVYLPAFIKSASTSSSVGALFPSPRIPFSDWNITFIPSGRYREQNVGNPIPKFTYIPSFISLVALLIIRSLCSLSLPETAG